MPQTQHVTIPVADGTSMQVYTVIPEGTGPFPAIILGQEAWGVNKHIRSVADRLGSEGFVVIAPELFHRTAPTGFESSDYADFSAVMPHFQGVNLETIQHDVKASYDWLVAQAGVIKDKIASMGFCIGGRVAFIANATLPLAAGISYYGGGADQLAHLSPGLHGAHLFFWGGLDTHIPQEARKTIIDSVEAAGKSYINVVISYADHGFNCDVRASYNKDAAAEAWALSLAFLRNKLA
jgi:carboxymethylenebutenolidase